MVLLTGGIKYHIRLAIRLKLLKLGALVTISVRRIKIAIASACPLKGVFVNAHQRLCQQPYDAPA